jgi:hypothetical protein
VAQAERLAAVHDPSGKMFNVGPVTVQEDGKVVSEEVLERRAKLQAEKACKLSEGGIVPSNGETSNLPSRATISGLTDGVSSERQTLVSDSFKSQTKRLSKSQQKKLAVLEERLPPPKPIIPDGIELPAGEENWLSLWDLSDDELERRVVREKKRRAAERKALRERQKEGKAERRAARDERRRVYREKKLEWKAIKGRELSRGAGANQINIINRGRKATEKETTPGRAGGGQKNRGRG